jgi:hypothetical protein
MVKRWQIDEENQIKIHKGEGYSDHLPIYAKFSTNKNEFYLPKDINSIEKNSNKSNISDLYKKEKITDSIIIEKAIVIYKDNDKAIIKRQNDRAIYIYKNVKDLKLGYSYNLQINQINDYYGLKEITDFTILNELEEITNYKSLYLDSNNMNLFDFKYENEIITNLKGIVKQSKLYLEDGKIIKLYTNNKNLLPKNEEKITIISGHLATYRGNIQIILYQATDFKIGF